MASHSSGITVSEEVRAAFGEANVSGTVRMLKVQIAGEKMNVVASEAPGAQAQTWEDDLDRVPALLDPKDACYILFRTDDRSPANNGFYWLLLCYVPDACKVFSISPPYGGFLFSLSLSFFTASNHAERCSSLSLPPFFKPQGLCRLKRFGLFF